MPKKENKHKFESYLDLKLVQHKKIEMKFISQFHEK